MSTAAGPKLTAFERIAVAIGRSINEQPLAKQLQQAALNGLTWRWVWFGISKRVYVDGLAHVLDLVPRGGVVLAVNHRSFFDLWVTMLPLFSRQPPWMQRVFFPVRSEFFYERPLGLLVNMTVAAGCMYPPIFRDPNKAALNGHAMAVLTTQLQRPGTLVGMHPEGTRNRGDDPYQLLPAKPGIGQIVLGAQPTVIPVFVSGLSNNMLTNVHQTWLTPESRFTNPVIVTLGEPVDYSEFVAQKPRITLYKRLADKIRDGIKGCAARERLLRADIEAHRLDDATGWLNP